VEAWRKKQSPFLEFRASVAHGPNYALILKLFINTTATEKQDGAEGRELSVSIGISKLSTGAEAETQLKPQFYETFKARDGQLFLLAGRN
jgi:hypothetical protein